MNIKKTGLVMILGLLLVGAAGFSSRSTASTSKKSHIPSPHSMVQEPVGPTSAGSWPATAVHAPLSGISGKVLDPDGNGVAGATVMAFPASRSLRRCCMQAPSTPMTKTDLEGWFRFENIHPGVELIAFKSAGTLVSRVVDTPGPHFLSFPQGKLIEGIVRDEEGNLLPDVHLRAHVRPNLAAALQMGRPPETASDATGSFVIGPIAPGTSVLVEASLSGYRPVRTTVLVDGTSPVLFTPLVMKRGERLTGSIVAADGSPLSGVVLTARQRNGASFQVRSSEDGTFEISGIGHGEIQLSARLSGFADSTFSVPGTEAPVEIELRKSRSLGGRVSSSRTGLYAVAVEGNSRYRTPVQPDGSFHFVGLSAGHVRILIESEDRNILTSRQVLLDENPALLTISLQ